MIKKLGIVAMSLMLAACGDKEAIISRDKVVRVCADIATQQRTVDGECEMRLDGVRWFYIRYHDSWPLALPAVADRVENGRYTWEHTDKEDIVSIPQEGARFADK